MDIEGSVLTFPEHIWIKIFEYSEVSDLNSLTQSCLYFNNLISAEKCIMSKFCFKWRINQRRSIIKKSIKQYQHVSIDLTGDYYRKSTVALFEKFAPTLESFTIINNGIYARDIFVMLQHLAKRNIIKKAKFVSVFLRQPKIQFTLEDTVKVSSLKELHVEDSDCRILGHFLGTQVTRFTFYLRNACNLQGIKDFLKTQKNLEFIKLDAPTVREIFRTDHSASFDFKLQEVELNISHVTRNQANHINNLLKKQPGLKSVKIVIEELCNLLVVVAMLRDINIDMISLQFHNYHLFYNDFPVGDLLNVTHIVININKATHRSIMALYRLSNVTELILNEAVLNFALYDALKEMKKMTKVVFKKTQIVAFCPLPQVKEMVFHAQGFKEIAKFLKVNDQLEKVRICGDAPVHAGYLIVILRKCKHVKHLDISKLQLVDDIFLASIAKYGGDLSTLILPMKYKVKEYSLTLPTTLAKVEYA